MFCACFFSPILLLLLLLLPFSSLETQPIACNQSTSRSYTPRRQGRHADCSLFDPFSRSTSPFSCSPSIPSFFPMPNAASAPPVAQNLRFRSNLPSLFSSGVFRDHAFQKRNIGGEAQSLLLLQCPLEYAPLSLIHLHESFTLLFACLIHR